MLTCREAAALVSQSVDRRLSWRERWALRAHLAICTACTRFRQQVEFLHAAARECARRGAEALGQFVLSREARDRIRQALERGA